MRKEIEDMKKENTKKSENKKREGLSRNLIEKFAAELQAVQTDKRQLS
jgi:hypothetical protein